MCTQKKIGSFFLLHGVDKDSYSHHISNLLVRDTKLVDSVVSFTASKMLGSKYAIPECLTLTVCIQTTHNFKFSFRYKCLIILGRFRFVIRYSFERLVVLVLFFCSNSLSLFFVLVFVFVDDNNTDRSCINHYERPLVATLYWARID